MAEIPDAPAIVSLDGPELLLARDDTGDVKVTADQISDFVKDSLTPAETLAKVIASNPQVNGLNANLLEGFTSTFFRNASNLTAGTVPDARLPLGEFDYSWSSGGLIPTEGSLKCYWKLPLFVTDGVPSGGLMFQFGWTNFVYANTKLDTTFLQPFSSFLSTANKPFIQVTPECKGNDTATPDNRVELDMRLDNNSKSLTGFSCSSIRTKGSDSDMVRGNWLAVGFYS